MVRDSSNTAGDKRPDEIDSGHRAPSRHHVTGEDYPFEWARRFEHWLDVGHRRTLFYGLSFVVFVVLVVALAATFAVVDAPPT